jgi:hypothetical protein
MAIREVIMCRKDEDGEIVALCNPDAIWSPRLKGDAINDIENDTHTYYVLRNRKRVDIKIVHTINGKRLRTEPVKTVINNFVNQQD